MTWRAAIPLMLTFAMATNARAGSDSSWVAPTDRLNLRDCPGTVNCPVRTTLPPRTELEVLGRDGEWLQVRVLASGEVGWVHSAYTTFIPRPAGAPQSSSGEDGAASRIATFVGKLVPFVLVGAGLFIMGYSGRVMRRGIGMKNALKHAKEELKKEGKQINEEKWGSVMRGAKLRIGLPFVFWAILYIALYRLLPFNIFALSLLALLLPMMGYLGFFLVPGLEGLIGDD